MAHDLEAFRERFPEFASTDDTIIEFAIADAEEEVDEDRWAENDFDPAILFLAAHFIAAGNVASESVEDGGPPIKSETIGRISTTYGDPASAESLSTTNYGSRFLRIQSRNASHAAII